jgi:cell division septum initiation protein DivIVA
MLVAIAIQQYLYPLAIMAPRQTAKVPVNGKKPASRRQLMTPTKAKMNRPGRKPGRKPRAEVEAAAALAAAPAAMTSDDGDLTTLLSNLTKQLIVQQQAIATQAWLTKEIDVLRQQGGGSAPSKTTGRIAAAASNSPELLAEISQLRQENSDLREKAARLDQMASLLGLSDAVAAAPAKVKGKPGRPAKNPLAVAAQAIAAPAAKVPGKRGPKPKVKVAAEVRPLVVPMARSSSKASILKAAAERDVARTFKSCWPVVFKIEEWNAKNPARLAKISQTMLNKCGVNFARAKQFVEAHEAIILRYHNDIGLNKANSGKFNEVYEFVRDSLGKGRRS